MPEILFVSHQILVLLALSLIVVRVGGIVLKRLLAFLLLLSIPFVAPYFTPLLLLIFAACIALVAESTKKEELADKTKRTEIKKTKEESRQTTLFVVPLFVACLYLGNWILFVFPEAKELFKLMPIDSDFHPASWQTLFTETGWHPLEGASSLLALLLSGSLALKSLIHKWNHQRRKGNASHKH